MKKFFCFFIFAAAAAFLTACSAKGGQSVNLPGLNEDIITESAENDAETKIEFPKADMNGKKFVILTSGWWGTGENPLEVSDLCPEELIGEQLNDAAYNRKIKIEEQYNCKIEQIKGSYDPVDDVGRVKKAVQANENMYDIAMIRGLNFQGLLTGNYIIDLDGLENINFDYPWWQKQCSDALLILGSRYGVSGNFTSIEASLAALTAFNKSIIESYGLESPYEIVKRGEWTLGKVVEMAKIVTHDLNGDGTMTYEDMWGIAYDRDRLWNLINGSGVNLLAIDSEGYPKITIDAYENLAKIQNIYIKIFDESYSSNSRRIGAPFKDEGVLFKFCWALDIVELRAYDFDFGIIPIPKYDENQNSYISNIYGFGLPIICVPATNRDMENTGLFMELMSYEGYKELTPVFYENILKTKSARDSESADMIDYIFKNLHYDTGSMINIGNFSWDICAMCETIDTNIASFVEKNKPKYEREIEKIIAGIIEDR